METLYNVAIRRKARRGFSLDSVLTQLAKEFQISFEDNQEQATLAARLDLQSALAAMKPVETLGAVTTLVVSGITEQKPAIDGYLSVGEFCLRSPVPESTIIEGLKSGEFVGYVDAGVHFIKVTETGGAEIADVRPSKHNTSRSFSTFTTRSFGHQKCEFCHGLNKPDVTFCKHCGLKVRG